jgi:Family of unknown function (DUF6088)
MSQLEKVKKQLQPGEVYRRADLVRWSSAVDRHLRQLQQDGTLTKLSGGLYYYPKKTAFGEAPADDKTIVQAFLKDDRFLLTSSNAYNALGVGTTQLYNETVVYNHKRHGRFVLGGRGFNFRVKPHFPETLSEAFLLVDLLNNLDQLAEDHEMVLRAAQKKASTMDQRELREAAQLYGGVRAQKFLAEVLEANTVHHVA